MAGRNPADAVQNYVDPLQLALSCITRAVINIRGGYHEIRRPGGSHRLTLGDGQPIPLQAPNTLQLFIGQRYIVVRDDRADRGPWPVNTVKYEYTIEDGEHEILAYHWHPDSTVTWPHLHLKAGADIGRRELSKSHLPTGRVSIEAVIRYLIMDFDVRPERDDWAAVLAHTEGRFVTYRDWA